MPGKWFLNPPILSPPISPCGKHERGCFVKITPGKMADILKHFPLMHQPYFAKWAKLLKNCNFAKIYSSLSPRVVQRRYILREEKAPRSPPPSSSIATPFPCLYNSTVGFWQLYRQTSAAVYSRQSSYTDREKSSQLMTRGGGCLCFCIYIGYIFFEPP